MPGRQTSRKEQRTSCERSCALLHASCGGTAFWGFIRVAAGKRGIVAALNDRMSASLSDVAAADTDSNVWTKRLQIGEQPDTIIPTHIGPGRRSYLEKRK